MIVYRITKRKHATDLSGKGSALYPGRWNKKGTPVLYTGTNPEIALLESIVHIQPMMTPRLDMLTIEFPEDTLLELWVKDLPSNWDHFPAPTILGDIIQAYIDDNQVLAIKVPSCIIPTAHNVILNCKHDDYHLVKLIEQKPFNFDKRLIYGKPR